MSENYSMNKGTRLVFYTFLISLIIPLLGIIIEIGAHDLGFSISSIFKVHELNKSLLLLDFIPVLLTVMAVLVNGYFDKMDDEKQMMKEKQANHLKNLKDYVNGILDENHAANNQSPESTIKSDDLLGQSLISLKETISENKEAEKDRKKEEDQRRWQAEGMAKFGDILRKDNEDIEKLTYNVLSNMVKYVGANQGGFFIINDDDEQHPFLEQKASFAYDRKKYADKKLSLDEGLIGSAIFEKEKIYLTEVPESYVEITSGLGHSTPKTLLIVPLVTNEEVYGAFEMASFYEFEDYKLNFIDEVAESIATTIANIKTNLRTSRLLNESIEKSEQLSAQEEEMRQNMEELQATQEELQRQTDKFRSFTDSVNKILIRAEFGIDGSLAYGNPKFIEKLEYQNEEELGGKSIFDFIDEKDRNWFSKIWEELINSCKPFEGYMKFKTKTNQDLWTIATYACVMDVNQNIERILFLSIDNTEQKKQSLDFQGQINALKQSTIKAEFFNSGIFLDANRRFRDFVKMQLVEVFDKEIFELIPNDQLDEFREYWQQVINGMPYEGEFQLVTKDHEIKWLRGTFTGVKDMYGEIAKVILIANDITHTKRMEIQTRDQADQLKKQEEKLLQSEANLSKNLKKAKEEIKQQFKEIEKVKVRNEKTLEGAIDAILTINQEGTVEFFNKSAENLWNIRRNDILGKNIKQLFPVENRDNPFIASLVDPDAKKEVGVRKEVNISNREGEEKSVIILLSEAMVEDEYTYTAFIQDISVDLF